MTTSITDRPRSKEIYHQLTEVLPAGVNSPVRSFPGLRFLPLVAESGQGAILRDPDNNSYIDFCCSWGALLHGHAHPVVTGAVQRRLAKGSSFGVTTEIEGLLARKVIECMPSIEQLRFVSSGTEATMAAARLARGVTGRETIVKFVGNYHGSCDAFLVKAGSGVAHLNQEASSAGVPASMVQHTVCLPYNDELAVREFFSDVTRSRHVAGVIVEPIAGNMGVVPATPSFFRTLRELTREAGALLIVDEVITGFRVGLGGAQELYGIQGDLTCLGKIVAGGFPAAAFGGSRELMHYLAPLGEVYQGGTLSGNPIAMEGGLQTLLLAQEPHFYEILEKRTRLLTDPIENYIRDHELDACLQRVGSMFTLFLGPTRVRSMEEAQKTDFELFAQMFRFLFDRGIYIPPSPFESWFVSSVHEEEQLIHTRDCVLEFLREAMS